MWWSTEVIEWWSTKVNRVCGGQRKLIVNRVCGGQRLIEYVVVNDS